jgi:hypothetical protein
VYWAFSDSSAHLTTYGNFFKNTLLKFDLVLQCFYIETLPVQYPHLVSIAVTSEAGRETQEFDVLVNNDDVASNGNFVVTDLITVTSADRQTKFLAAEREDNQVTVSFADYKLDRDGFLDWGTVEKPAYLITGFNMGGVGPVRAKTAPMITVFAKRTEELIDADIQPTKESSIKMTTRWDFTDNAFPGKWSDEYEVYRKLRPYYRNTGGAYDDGYPLIITRNKVRGRGKALQLKWQAGQNKDMRLVGWSINFVGNTNV